MRTDDLAAAGTDDRENKERRVAIAAAVAGYVRTGGVMPPALLARALAAREKRIDGTQMTTHEHETTRKPTTNHADGVTSSLLPLETNREDY